MTPLLTSISDYFGRRYLIASVARGDATDFTYTPEEERVWREVRARLEPLHRQAVARPLRRAAERLRLPADRIPRFAELNSHLQAATGFRLSPVEGLVPARAFLSALGRGVFLATEYVRHGATPWYTPEPDVIHELVGHAAGLLWRPLADTNRAFGHAAALADDDDCRALARVYWHALEFGVVEEGGRAVAFGAGLLSSVAELERLPSAELRAWDLERAAATPYETTTFQPSYFVAPSWRALLRDLQTWLADRFGGAVLSGPTTDHG